MGSGKWEVGSGKSAPRHEFINRFPTTNFQLPTTNFPQPTSNFPLPTSHNQPPTSNFLLSWHRVRPNFGSGCAREGHRVADHGRVRWADAGDREARAVGNHGRSRAGTVRAAHDNCGWAIDHRGASGGRAAAATSTTTIVEGVQAKTPTGTVAAGTPGCQRHHGDQSEQTGARIFIWTEPPLLGWQGHGAALVRSVGGRRNPFRNDVGANRFP